MICREAHQPGTEHSRVFCVTLAAWENVGTAKRGALKFGEEVINDLVPGESVASLYRARHVSVAVLFDIALARRVARMTSQETI